jgi:colanic acid/amylovoran biosynthesis glycosyltransferase
LFLQAEGVDVYKHLFARGEYFVTNCKFFRKRAISLGCPEDRIDVIGSGTNLDVFTYHPAPWPASGPIKILSIGRLVEKKGWRYSIEAVADQIRSGARIDYQIVGEGEERAALQGLIVRLGVAEQIRLIGKRESAEIVELLRNVHIFLAPSVTAASGDTDGPTNTLKEAMATGVPVIATRHGGIPELVEDGVTGLLVAERDGTALAEAIARLVGAPALRETLVKAARRRVEETYDLQTLNQQLLSLYAQVAENHHRNSPA